MDLCHRSLLRTGDRFWLLPQTHPPINHTIPLIKLLKELMRRMKQPASVLPVTEVRPGIRWVEGLP